MEGSVLFRIAGCFYWEPPPPVSCSAGVTELILMPVEEAGCFQSCLVGINGPEHCIGTGGTFVLLK